MSRLLVILHQCLLLSVIGGLVYRFRFGGFLLDNAVSSRAWSVLTQLTNGQRADNINVIPTTTMFMQQHTTHTTHTHNIHAPWLGT